MNSETKSGRKKRNTGLFYPKKGDPKKYKLKCDGGLSKWTTEYLRKNGGSKSYYGIPPGDRLHIDDDSEEAKKHNLESTKDRDSQSSQK